MTRLSVAAPHAAAHLGQAGITLIELVSTLAIVAVVTSFSVPALTGLITGTGLTAATNTLVADMRLARSEAVRRGAQVVICGSRDGTTCSGSTDWDSGWLLFVDADADGALARRSELADGDEVIRVTRREPDGLRLGASHSWVAYRSDGSIRAR
jgi:type IV fimbrial biogenesis protein FimT